MKLRIRGDSVRLRLTQSEVNDIGTGKAVRESTRFIDGSSLHYSLETQPSIRQIEVQMLDNCLAVRLPSKMASSWALSLDVAIKYQQAIPGEPTEKLFVLIEKDFNCLKVRENETEDESDMFANPNTHKGSCG